ncbi:DUF2141 domain-containing protein [Cellulophaga sp. Z1A5H]|uniref:DUF2141 domain-containing protein n=1 Tax=Cellulophaga sp. Z1A5H TaxID=2687291 RepID=UPI0013FD9233|nr:DUF2141 domain-containing protein [Cellulophaga sp. Z1A5H]
MKNLVVTSILILCAFFAKAQDTQSYTLVVSIGHITNNNGKILLSLHTADTFMKGPGIQNVDSEIVNGKINVSFENIKPGTYAIMALHDENDNKRMDYETNGMPKENYGTSGNEMSYGPPSFEDAKFRVTDKNLDFNIRF